MKLTKSKIVRKILLPIMVGFSFLTAVTSTVAWFKDGVSVTFNGNEADFNLVAGAEASYYGGGTGASNDPYIISNKLHLYNLAWLQYLGVYNKTTIRQLYFKVTADIDMDGITLPPIGTDQYPFLGHFDGNNKTISNLTISNDDPLQSDSDFGVMKPALNTLEGTTPPEIVGFFGVVGKLPTQDFTYDSSIVSMSNLTISNIDVVSESSKTLIGLAAGYVNGNMTGIKIGGQSSLTVAGQTAVSNTITNKLSDYGLVGYAANKGASGEYKQTLSKYYDSDDDTQGGGENWGGSIDMASLYKRLTTIELDAQSYTPTYVYNESYLNGVYEDRASISNASERRWHMNTNDDYAGNYVLTGSQSNKVYLVGGHYINQLYYTATTETGYYITDGNGHYLSYNGSALTNTDATNATVWLFQNTSGTSQIYTNYLNTSNYTVTTVYLRSNNNALAAYNGTNTGSSYRTSWTLTKNGNELSIVYNNYHLVYYNNSWTLRQNGYGDDYVQTTNNPSFYVVGNTDQSYYIAGSNSLSNGTTVSRTNNINDAAHFTLNNSNQVYITSNGYNFYPALTRSGRNNNYTYSLAWRRSTGTNYAYFVYNSTNNYFSATLGNATRYLAYANNAWTVSESPYTISLTGYAYEVLKLSNTLDGTPVQKAGRQLVDNNSHGHMEFDNEDTTYFPINVFDDVQEDELGNVTAKKYEPTPTNTGYVVGGTTNTTYASENRSIVVSNYPRDRILYHSVDDNGNLTHIKTINQTGIIDLNETGLQKYNDYLDEHGETVSGSKTKFQNVIKGSSNVGGFHFVNKDSSSTFCISKDNLVDATNIKVNGATYTGNNEKYQLPVYSIDFNLKKQGYINFFAGTYNGGYSTSGTKRAGTNQDLDDHINAFFSLHHIIRDHDDKKIIDEIKEIKAIYSSPNSVEYTYSYKQYTSGNNYTVVDKDGNAFNSSGLTLLFDTDWIGYRQNRELQDNSDPDSNDPTKGTLGAIFYFEIPVDSGEYCLGNVRNSVDTHVVEGAYLMYLDIGANGTEGTAHYSGYNITTYVNPVSFPTGVDFAIDGLTNAGLGGETLCIFIDVSESGTIYFSVNEEDAQGHVPANDTIAIDDESDISQFSYLSANANSGFDIVGDNLPAEYEDPPDSNFIVTRVSYLSLVTVSGDKFLITVTDELDEDGEVTSTIYHLSYTDENDELVSTDCSLADLQDIVPSAEDYFINTIRGMITVVTIDRLSATSVSFNAQLPELPWTNASNMYLVTLNIPTAYSVKVSVINSSNYSVCINNETPLVFTNNQTTYIQP